MSTLRIAFAASLLLAACGNSDIKKKGNSTPNGTPNNLVSNSQTNSTMNSGTNGGTNSGTNNVTPTDADGDGLPNAEDNCPGDPNAGQADIDGDTVGDVCDNCPDTANRAQTDDDDDDIGNTCEEQTFYTRDRDRDGDGRVDLADNCLEISNADQADTDADGVGDACDNCPSVPNSEQDDEDADGEGNACSEAPAGPICETVTGGALAPDMWLILDNSGSMADDVQQYRPGVIDFLIANADDTRIGLSGQADDGLSTCTDTLYLELGDHTAGVLNTAVSTQYNPNGPSTPNVGLGAVSSGNYLDDATDPFTGQRDKIVVLMTDGPENSCDTSGTSADNAAALATAGATVHVVAYAWDNQNPTSWVTDVAAQGGGTSAFATNEAELETELQRIRDTAPGGGCVFALEELPDENRLWVSVDGTFVDEGTANGYSRSGLQIELVGTSCDAVEAGADVEIMAGCAVQCQPQTEVCDYVDNSCEGTVDEGCGDCEPEVCNGIDDDCDGQIDEGC